MTSETATFALASIAHPNPTQAARKVLSRQVVSWLLTESLQPLSDLQVDPGKYPQPNLFNGKAIQRNFVFRIESRFCLCSAIIPVQELS